MNATHISLQRGLTAKCNDAVVLLYQLHDAVHPAILLMNEFFKNVSFDRKNNVIIGATVLLRRCT